MQAYDDKVIALRCETCNRSSPKTLISLLLMLSLDIHHHLLLFSLIFLLKILHIDFLKHDHSFVGMLSSQCGKNRKKLSMNFSSELWQLITSVLQFPVYAFQTVVCRIEEASTLCLEPHNPFFSNGMSTFLKILFHNLGNISECTLAYSSSVEL